jgi:hypothetical protein
MKFSAAKRTFEFSVEKSETYTFRRLSRLVVRWCGDCGSEVEMSKPDAASEITGISTRKIYSGIEDGATHFTELPDGSLLVCLRSIGANSTGPQILKGESDQP